MQRIRGKLSFSSVIAVIALFIALGGSAYAVTELPKNSVGPKQLKKGAVTPAKLSAGAVADLTGNKGPTGSKGDRGEPGSTGPGGPAGTDAGREPLVIDASGAVADIRTSSSIPLKGTTSWTPAPGQVGLLLGKMTATLATEPGGFSCAANVLVFDNGTEVGYLRADGGPSSSFVESSTNLTPVGIDIHEPGAHTITATSSADTECKPGSKIDSVTLLVLPQG